MTRHARWAPLLLLLATGCAASASGQAPRARQVGHAVCLPAALTSGSAPSGAASGCRAIETSSPGWDDAWNLHLCGPCNFAYDDATTRRERAAGDATACCYEASSPPPPPLPSGGPRS